MEENDSSRILALEYPNKEWRDQSTDRKEYWDSSDSLKLDPCLYCQLFCKKVSKGYA